jgi:hypothetical protein
VRCGRERQDRRRSRPEQGGRPPAKTYAAEGKNHTTLNNDLGTPDDKPTKALFEFLDEVLRN